MDILYLIGEGRSKCDNNELKYSLRSIEKFGKNVRNVYVAGYCPEWLNDNVHKVPVKQIYEKPSNIVEKHINMLATILYVVDNTDISDEFLVSMDDHFYIREVDFDNYPVYAKIVRGDTKLKSRIPINNYGRFIEATKRLLESLGLPTQFFTLHRNMHASRKTIKHCRHILDRIIREKISCEHMAFMLNYQYSLQPFEFVPIKDVKVKNAEQWFRVNPEQTEVFSTYDFEEGSDLDNLIKGLYPTKSKYEL